MSFLPDKLPFAKPNRVTTAVIGISLIAISTAIYLSPLGDHGHDSQAGDAHLGVTTAKPAPPASPSPSHSATGRTSASPGRGHPGATGSGDGSHDKAGTWAPGTIAGAAQKSGSSGSSPADKPLHCSDFRWQQDAQAGYVKNLSDPDGLDGAPGPHNGDGLACLQLPVDPSRAASTPADPYVPPSPADKPALVKPAAKYFGVAEDGLPGDEPLFDKIATTAGKAPSSMEWFSYWDSGYDATKVQDSWAHGALPVITWLSVPDKSNAPDADKYTLANIAAGKFDSYLLKYAGSVLHTGLPVAIRLDHEMNGNWYPWSAGMPANQGKNGEPNLYVQAWQHVWNVFDSVGANSDVIWLWAPVRVDTIKPHSTKSGSKYETSLQEDYPGDKYVDWVGMSAYQYKPTDGWSYQTTFGKTLDALADVTTKPVFVAETAATQAVGDTDYGAEKAAWTQATLAGLLADPQVVGFAWFNNTVNDVHKVDGESIQTDWQFSSSAPALAAFRAGIADAGYASGIMPDTA